MAKKYKGFNGSGMRVTKLSHYETDNIFNNCMSELVLKYNELSKDEQNNNDKKSVGDIKCT